jgi:hypothetical protein
MICKEAKRVLGKGYEGWPSLDPETIAREVTGDSPRLCRRETRVPHSHCDLPAHVPVGLAAATRRLLRPAFIAELLLLARGPLLELDRQVAACAR